MNEHFFFSKRKKAIYLISHNDYIKLSIVPLKKVLYGENENLMHWRIYISKFIIFLVG